VRKQKILLSKSPTATGDIKDQEYFDHGVAMVAFIKAGVELAFETMVASGIVDSAYYGNQSFMSCH
jgi:ketol-acid reductoisomerase